MLIVLALAALPSAVSCKTSRAGQELVDPSEVPADLRDEWATLVEAREQDRSSDAVEAAADALLDQSPPPGLRAGALHAKAERAYLLADDGAAIRWADEAAQLLAGEAAPGRARETTELRAQVHRTLALALVRGGDPARALAELERLEGWGTLDRVELRGGRAVARDRQGDVEGALAAFVAWRELLADDSADAGYAEARIRALVGGVDRAGIEALAEAATGPRAADCLRATLGVEPASGAPAWVLACRPLPKRIGVLLPRSGKLAALADAQLAAVVAAVTVLGRERPVELLWRDSGSSPGTARTAAERIVADGADVIIGPIGVRNVEAAVAVAGDERFLLPGESVADARGVAASLDARARALVDYARGEGAASLIVMLPENGYGRRVRKALEGLEPSQLKRLKFIDYSPKTTSFSPLLAPVLKELRGGSALLVADALPRTELIIRQLRRERMRVRDGSVDREGAEVLVLATGEGFSPDRIGAKHASLDGVVIAPVAFPDSGSRAFEAEYRAQQGVEPDDQALLVWRALSAAWSGASGTLVPEAAVLRIQGSQLVALKTP